MKEKRGRPRAIDKFVIAKLEKGFLMGFSDREACLFANINPATLYRFCEENPDFSERKELLKEQIKLRAKQNIAEAIENRDKPLSQWYLERRDKEFKPKSDMDLNLPQNIIDLFKNVEQSGDTTIPKENTE